LQYNQSNTTMNIINYSGDQSLFATVLFTRLPPSQG
jgi:hypothetical protein